MKRKNTKESTLMRDFLQGFKRAAQQNVSDFVQIANIYSIGKLAAGGMPVPERYPPSIVLTHKQKKPKTRWGLLKKTSIEEDKFKMSDLDPRNLELIFGQTHKVRRNRPKPERHVFKYR